MKVFVWERVDKCSDHYHSGGGVVVFADSLERAVCIANAEDGCEIAPEEKPDHVRECDGDSEAVIIMPDAGCC